jgi:hypothetical protein
MLDFTEQVASTTLPPKLSPDTPTVSDNLQDIKTLADPAVTAATIAKLAPYRTDLQYVQVTEKPTEIS